MRLFGSLTKIEDQPDGTLKVYGVASTGARDDAGEIVRPEAMKAALPDYARYPALREMHQATAAGRTLEASVDDDGATRIVAHVVDPVAIAKVKSRTYAGFSIGGRVLARDPKDATVITKIKLSEISLVDRPANPEAVIDLWKAELEQRPPRTPGNEDVKSRAAEMARRAGRPGAWKDYVAKARAALIDEQADDDPDVDDEGDDAGYTDMSAANDSKPLEDSGDTSATWSAAATDSSDADADYDDGEYKNDGDASNADYEDGDDASHDRADASYVSDRHGVGDPSHVTAAVAASLAALAGASLAALQAVHDALAALGCACDPDNCDDMSKALDADLDDPGDARSSESGLAKALGRVEALERRLAEQSDLVERLAATPLPARTAASQHARLVGKVEDADPAAGEAISASDAQKAFASLTADERAFLLMKASLRNPIPIP